MNNLEIIEKLIIMITSFLVGSLITYFFTIKIENYKFDVHKRKQAEKIAELFALWVKKKKIIEGDEEHCKELNQLAWELAIWIPEERLIKKIMNRLANKSESPNIKEIIIEMREFILQKKSKELNSSDLVHFISPKKE